MSSYIGRTVFIPSMNSYGTVISETWECGPVLEIELKDGKTIWRHDYDIVVM